MFALWRKDIRAPVFACFFSRVFVRQCVHVIVMSWAEAIWVGCLICISGVNYYKYLWPQSKLVWIFILMGGVAVFPISRREMNSTFRVADENTWRLPWAPRCMLGEHHVYVICHMVAIFDVQRSITWMTHWAGWEAAKVRSCSSRNKRHDDGVEPTCRLLSSSSAVKARLTAFFFFLPLSTAAAQKEMCIDSWSAGLCLWQLSW